MKKLNSLIAVCVGITSFATCSHAFISNLNLPGSGTISLGGGYDFFSNKRHVKNSGFPMVALGYNFNEHWGVEAMGAWWTTYFKNNIPNRRKVNAALYLVDGVFRFCPYYNFKPYLMLGWGIVHLNPNRFEPHDQGNINGGIGIAYNVYPRLSVRFDARDVYTITGGFNDVVLDAGVTYSIWGT